MTDQQKMMEEAKQGLGKGMEQAGKNLGNAHEQLGLELMENIRMANDALIDEAIKKDKGLASDARKHIGVVCEKFTKSELYKPFDESAKKKFKRYCCSVTEFGCPFYKTTWFMFACIGVGVLIIVIIIIAVVLCCVKKGRGGGGKDAIEDIEKEENEDKDN